MDRNKLLDMLTSSDTEITLLALNLLRSNYDTKFLVMGYPGSSVKHYVYAETTDITCGTPFISMLNHIVTRDFLSDYVRKQIIINFLRILEKHELNKQLNK